MKEKFTALFEYNQAMNIKVIDLLTLNYNKISEKALLLLSHTLNAHQIWNARIQKEKEFAVWQLNDWNFVRSINENNYQNTLKILQNDDLNRIVIYHNSKGDQFENKLEDILFHVINHSTYHRAQIATECRSNGIEPLISDYIMFKRNS